MKRLLKAAIIAAALMVPAQAWASGITLYDATQTTAGNLPSLGYEATQTREFGQAVDLLGNGPFELNTVSILMSNWARESTYEAVGTSLGYMVNMTANIYAIGPGDNPGPLLESRSVAQFIAWRPEADPTCSGTAYRGADGNCYNGSLSLAPFDFTGATIPDKVIIALAFNTQTAGYSPTGLSKPENSLNFALNSATTVGTNLQPGSVEWATNFGAFYTDGGAGGVGFLRPDTNWFDNNGNPYDAGILVEGNEVPEPASLLLFGSGALGLIAHRRRKANAAA